MDYHVITRERHGLKRWSNQNGYSFAAADSLCPLVAQELSKALHSLPIGFVAEGEGFVLVAVQGLTPGKNVLVAPDGRWLSAYIPAAYRSYPFAMVAAQEGEQVLCFDEASGLLSDDAGELFFNEDGSPSQSMLKLLEFFQQIDANRQQTHKICTLLQQHGLIQPWPITVHREQGEQGVEGLFRIDEEALNMLPAEALVEVRNAGGLAVAYCQLLSMPLISNLAQLAQAHAEAEKASAVQVSQPKASDLDLGFMSDSGTFNFGN